MTYTPADEVRLVNKYENEILELVENQLRDDEDTLTQSDLQGCASAIVMNILRAGKEIGESMNKI